MNKYKIISLLIIFVYIAGLFFIVSTTQLSETKIENLNGKSDIILEFYYVEGCSSCEEAKTIITELKEEYKNNLTIYNKPLAGSENKDNYEQWKKYYFRSYPSAVLKNRSIDSTSKYYKNSITLLDKDEYSLNETFEYKIVDLTYENLKNEIEYHLEGNYTQQSSTKSDTVISTPLGEIDYSESSLPVLTIIIGAADSVNPCSFFVLLFLLSILLYTKSRKKMLLVGGIFIFFSGFIYFLLMVTIMNATEIIQLPIIAIFAGIVAIIFGILNIKDFFFFKKGISTSIPEAQKSKLYKQIRKIVKITSIPSLILATITLAVSANTVELLCSLGLPLVYTGTILPLFNLSSSMSYMYLFFYNVVYIIPLLVIVLIIVMTLGRWKLTEFQGQILKLFSGFMILSLGIILVLKVYLLENVLVTISILVFSLILTYVLSLIWKLNPDNIKDIKTDL